jgi:nucleotide-binding universal stress UspA family protein
METGTIPTIVVGVNGSRGSAAALRWATDEARRRDARLRVVLCWKPEARAYYAPQRGLPDSGGHIFARQLAATVREVLDGDTPRGLTTQVVEGEAERALVAESAGADLLVLGSTSPGQAGLAVGPVIRACLSRARCPVVVVGPADPEGIHQGRHGGLAQRPAALASSRGRPLQARPMMPARGRAGPHLPVSA